MDKKAVLFVMTDDTRNCDEVAEFLESQLPGTEWRSAGDPHQEQRRDRRRRPRGKNKEELDLLRKQSREIDSWENQNKAVVSVMVLREGWDVQNVTTIVGSEAVHQQGQDSSGTDARPRACAGCSAARTSRRRCRSSGRQAFIDFVESIKSEGVDLEYRPMGERTSAVGPMVIEVDRDNNAKDIETLDIELPRLTARIEREYKNLDLIDPLARSPMSGCR